MVYEKIDPGQVARPERAMQLKARHDAAVRLAHSIF
jgi:hypothetical protein